MGEGKVYGQTDTKLSLLLVRVLVRVLVCPSFVERRGTAPSMAGFTRYFECGDLDCRSASVLTFCTYKDVNPMQHEPVLVY